MRDEMLVLGPLLRYVDETSASVWVEVARAGVVVVHAGGRRWQAPTFAVHGRHYALVDIDGLEPGTVMDYGVTFDGDQVWPPADSQFPPSRIATLKERRRVRMAFGSCRTSIGHDPESNRKHGVDALRAYALHMAAGRSESWPDLVVFLGDQVYADETSEEMRAFIESRRDIDEPPGQEIKDYEEYAHLYSLAWTDPANRWLLSTLPSAMIFDDHDIRDDWNTSITWRKEMQATSWWQERIVAGLASYWVYQHLGNLSRDQRAEDEVWCQIQDAQEAGETADFGPLLDKFAARVDEHPNTYRWSYSRDLGGSRLIVVDSRAARELADENRSILDAEAMGWLDEQMQGAVDHLFVGTSLPFLLSRGLHEFEAWSEAVGEGAWGERARAVSEKVRRTVDLEHWAAFQDGFRTVAAIATAVADGRRGEAPSTVTFLSGDVHNSYVAEVDRPGPCRIIQAVCSPIRNPLPWSMRRVSGFSSMNVGGGFGRWLARRARVPDPPFTWRTVHGPWFDNNLATLETDERKLWIRWERGVDHDNHSGILGRLARRPKSEQGREPPLLEIVQQIRVDA
jgi:hypothetical protein